MSYDEENDLDIGFKNTDDEEDELSDMPEMDFGLDEEDPDKDH